MILVTGATGFIGGHLVRLLLEKGQKIRAIYRKDFGTFLNKDEIEKIEWFQSDLLNYENVADALAGVEAVFHCAAIVSFDPNNKEAMHKNNVQVTAQIVNAMLDKNVPNLFYVSSVAALGRDDKFNIINEKNEWTESDENSAYAKSKYHAEMEVWRGEAEGLKVAIVNPGIVIGEGNWEQGSCALFKTAFDEFPYYTLGQTSFVDVKDVANALWILFSEKKMGERYILSAGNYSYKFVLEKMAFAFNKKPAHKLAKSWMIQLLLLWNTIKKPFVKNKSLISKETARSAQKIWTYSNEKWLNDFPNYPFNAIENCIERSARYYQKNLA